MFPIHPPQLLITESVGRHNGQTSAMYSLVSTKLIHNKDHLERLQSEFSREFERHPDNVELSYCMGVLDTLAVSVEV